MEKMTEKQKYNKQKIDTYVSVQDAIRLRSICKKYGFKSIYQLLQYLVHCFLRVADPENDPIEKPLSKDIEEMFTSNEEWEMRTMTNASHEGMNITQKPDQRKYQTPDDLK